MKALYMLACAASLAALPALADGDAAEGEKVFKKCQGCHAVGEGATNKSGPALNGIVGAAVGSVEGYRYSAGMLAKKDEGIVWDEESLDAFLTKPKDFVEKTKMSFPGLKDEEDRENVIAYLAQFGS